MNACVPALTRKDALDTHPQSGRTLPHSPRRGRDDVPVSRFALWSASVLRRFPMQLLNRRQLLQIDPLQPILEILRVLGLGFDLENVALGHHQPEGAVFSFVLERLEPGHVIDL